jgi:integrase
MAILKLIGKQSEAQKKRKSNDIMLMFRYTHQSKTTHFYTGKNIDIQYFDSKNQCIKRSYAGFTKFNLLLTVQRQKIEDIINVALACDINPTTEHVKGCYSTNKNEKDQREKSNIDFWTFVEGYFKEAKLKLNPNTIRSYNNILNNLKGFEKYQNVRLNWESFDVTFYYKFLEYYTGYKGLGNNGFGKIIKVLKSLLNCATERGINKSLSYKSREFKALREDVNSIYLDELELKTIMALNFSNDQKLDRARDLFIVGCFTGLRFSDFSKLTAENITGNLIRVKTKKTGSLVILPLLNEVKVILDKYNGNLPKAFCNQKMNEYLKQIGRKAQLVDFIEKSYTRGNTVVKETFHKWEVLCTHTARRSFATNMYKRGIDAMSIMQLTGHSTEKSFMTYIKISKEENALRILDQFKLSA